MATFADLFNTRYLTGGSTVEFSSIRLHYRGADRICRAFRATALTPVPDIYFRDGRGCPARGLVTITSSGVEVPLMRGTLTPDNGRCDNGGAWCIQRENYAGYLPTRSSSDMAGTSLPYPPCPNGRKHG
jgi:hypothetical protein